MTLINPIFFFYMYIYVKQKLYCIGHEKNNLNSFSSYDQELYFIFLVFNNLFCIFLFTLSSSRETLDSLEENIVWEVAWWGLDPCQKCTLADGIEMLCLEVLVLATIVGSDQGREE